MLIMPTVLRKDGFRIVIWTNDHEPMNVHIFTGEGEAVINIEDAKLVQVWEMSPRLVRQAKRIVEENRDILAEKWRDIHG